MADQENKIREFREKLSLSQKDFAEKFGVTETSVQNWESGALPRGDKLQRIKEAYEDVDLNWLLTGKGVPYNKGIEGEIRTADSRIPWAETRYHEADGTKFLVQQFTPPATHRDPDQEVPDPFVRGVGALRTIFDSGDPLLISAIQANLTAFEQAALKDKYLHGQSKRIQKLEDDCEALKRKIDALEESMKAGDALAGIDKTGSDTI